MVWRRISITKVSECRRITSGYTYEQILSVIKNSLCEKYNSSWHVPLCVCVHIQVAMCTPHGYKAGAGYQAPYEICLHDHMVQKQRQLEQLEAH